MKWRPLFNRARCIGSFCSAARLRATSGWRRARPASLGPMDWQVARRIYHLYLPLYFWMRHQLHEIRGRQGGAVVFGFTAPQGCGKTTTMNILQELFCLEGLRCEAVSIDDFYVPASWQEVLAELHPDNDLMQTRGNAGTHDVRLGAETLAQALKSSDDTEVLLPRYDKSAQGGRGDQVPRSSWKGVQTPCDVVILEGWMVGFKPQEDAAKIHPGLRLVNDKLKSYQAWDDLLDAYCVLAVDDIEQVYTWRTEAEDSMKNTRGTGMSHTEVRDFVSHFMPAYHAYRPQLYAEAERGVDGKPTLVCHIGPDRLPYESL
ncbi:unnamed protein product [Effrenium voratum]|nr:unnamed protein product [Effrenium voratum]